MKVWRRDTRSWRRKSSSVSTGNARRFRRVRGRHHRVCLCIKLLSFRPPQHPCLDQPPANCPRREGQDGGMPVAQAGMVVAWGMGPHQLARRFQEAWLGSIWLLRVSQSE